MTLLFSWLQEENSYKIDRNYVDYVEIMSLNEDKGTVYVISD